MSIEAIRKGGIYFSNDIYGEIDFTDLENLKLKTIIDGVENEYDVGGTPIEGFGLIMNPAPPTSMKVGDEFHFTLLNETSGVKRVIIDDDSIIECNSEKNTLTAKKAGTAQITMSDSNDAATAESRLIIYIGVTA